MSAVQQILLSDAPETSENAKTTAWAAAVVTAGGTVSSGRRTLVNNLFNSLDADSLTAKLNRLWLLAAENTQSASIDLINLATYSTVGGPSFTTDQGYTTNGSSSGLNLNSANAGTQNSSCFGFYLRTNISAGDKVQMGTSVTGGAVDFGCAIAVKWSDGSLYFALNDDNLDTGRTGPANTSGIYVISRTGSTTATTYKGGSSFANNSQTSIGVASFNYVLGAGLNSLGGPDFWSDGQYGMAFLGAAGMDSTDASNFTTIIQTYMTAVGA